MTSNFAMNNLVTYRDRRLHGADLLVGYLLFALICSVGALSNIGVAIWLYGQSTTWNVAGFLGACIGAVWNYSVSTALVWRDR
jgi:dolichol-phosphate mannosyltransferase